MYNLIILYSLIEQLHDIPITIVWIIMYYRLCTIDDVCNVSYLLGTWWR